MIYRILLLIPLFAVLFTASDPHFGSDRLVSEMPTEDATPVQELEWRPVAAYQDYLNDNEGRVTPAFHVSKYFYPNVNFWFLIYTQFTSSQVVIHDKSNLSLIYKVLDFSSLYEKNLGRNIIYVLQQKTTYEKIEALKQDLGYLARHPFSLEPASKAIYRILSKTGIQIPVGKHERMKFFQELRENVRSQTGQKNFIRDGIVRSLPYQRFIHDFFGNKGLPAELFAIPFLESSFNPRAESKVAAAGIWQFMPLTASFFVPKRTPTNDYRNNVAVSSVAATYLMHENFRILKSWDLAVTAYNSGTKHLLKTKRELGKDSVTLEQVIKHSDSAHFGFASKNFYSEFLALIHALAYRDELFSDLHDSDRSDVDDPIRFFLAKCSLKPSKTLSDDQQEDVAFHNHNLKDLSKALPRGFIISSKSSLPRGKFLELTQAQTLRKRPIEWVKLLGNQSCSTR